MAQTPFPVACFLSLFFFVVFTPDGHSQDVEFFFEGHLLSGGSSTCSILLDHPHDDVRGFSGALMWEPAMAQYIDTTLGEALAGDPPEWVGILERSPGNLAFGLVFFDIETLLPSTLTPGLGDELLRVELETTLEVGQSVDFEIGTYFSDDDPINGGAFTVELAVANPQSHLLEVQPAFATIPVLDLQTHSVLGEGFIRGDVDGALGANIGDAVKILQFILSGGETPSCRDAADCNDDGFINLGDPMFLFSKLFFFGPPLPAPGENCGGDPSEDSLDCLQPASCS